MSGHLPVAVLWDMDGTLVDTEPYWIEEEFALVAAHGGTWTTEQALALVGSALPTSARVIAEQGPVPLPPEQIIELLLDAVVTRVEKAIPWRPGALELLSALRAQGVRTALVTMSYQRLADAVLAGPELSAPGGPAGGWFDTVVTGDQVSHGKPHPEPYLEAARRLGVAPSDCVAIEDSPTGVASAVAAGVPVIAVAHTVPLHDAGADVLIPTLDGVTPRDLLALVAAARP